MNSTKNFLLALLILLHISCMDNKVKLPIKTSFGNLIKIEQKDMVDTSTRKITHTPEEILYLLTFEGKSEIPYRVEVQVRDIQRATPYLLENVLVSAPLIIDQEKNTQYSPVFAGSPDEAGVISPNGWKINGEVKNYIWTGTWTLHDSRIALVYLIPITAASKTASVLVLKDGEQLFRINY